MLPLIQTILGVAAFIASIAFFLYDFFSNQEGLYLSFKCVVCSQKHSKALLFIQDSSFFTCTTCGRSYTIDKMGKICLFRRDPFDKFKFDKPTKPMDYDPIIVPFEVESKPVFERMD